MANRGFDARRFLIHGQPFTFYAIRRYGILALRRAGIVSSIPTGPVPRIFFNRCVVILYDLPQKSVYPGVVKIEVFWFLFFWVHDQIVDRWISHVLNRIAIFINLLNKHFPVAPFHTKELVANVNDDGLSSRFLRLAHQEIRLVNTIEYAILRDIAADKIRQCGKHIDQMDYVVFFETCFAGIFSG